MSDRPVYTKSRSTKRNKTARLHGAFKGGFSAGHFNTVGSKKGWKPSYENEEEDVTTKDVEGDYYARPEWRTKARSKSNLSSKGRKKQTVSDFMDEEDENLFGGPDNVNDEFSHDLDRNISKQNINSDKSIEDLLSGDFSRIKGEGSIGKRLLRVLGWREQNNGSSYIYAPMEKNKNEKDDSIILSKKIKRIEVKLSKQKLKDLPNPKLDTYGLDYDPFHMAPEFRKHKEMRRKRAEMRAKSAASTDGSGRMNVYRTNDIIDGEDDLQVSRNEKHSNSSGVLAYETADDFIGSTTVSGFALHDDDDDVYDNQMGFNQKKNRKLNINKEDYHHEIYDASDSEVEDLIDDGMPKHEESKKVKDFASSLSIWTGGNSGKSVSGKTAVTSDGKPPMKGFVLAKGSMKTINMKRFPGPDLPLNYSPVPHDFGTSEKIEGIKNLSTNMSLDMLRARRNARKETVDENEDGQPIQRSLKPMAGGSFAALAESLKDRFTTSTKSNHANKDSNQVHTDPTKVAIHRKTISWQPSVLLCKRLNVAFPGKNGKPIDAIETKSGIHASLEEKFFQNEILGKIGNGSVKLPPKTEQHQLSGENFDVLKRPTMEIMKSIFEDDSENDDVLSDTDGNIDNVKKDIDCDNAGENVSSIRTNEEKEATETILSYKEIDRMENDASEYSSDSESDRGRKRERKHHRRKHRKGEKKKHHRKHSRSEKRKKRHKK